MAGSRVGFVVRRTFESAPGTHRRPAGGTQNPGHPRARRGACHALLGVAFLFGAAPNATSQACGVEEYKFTPADIQLGSFVGWSVAMDGDTAVLGAQGDDEPATNSGSAYVYVRDIFGNWAQQAELTASDGASGDEFGYSVAISGDTIVVGAQDADSPASNSGAAYIFVRTGSIWTQQAKLIASDGAFDDAFGTTVSISVDTVIAGAPFHTESNTGASYIFVRSGMSWSQQAKLTASDATTGDKFGTAVSISGERVIVGSPEDDETFSNSGSAYEFTRSGSTWTEQNKLNASDAGLADSFGYSVALEGDRVIVGSPSDDTPAGANAGSAYVFLWTGSSWFEEGKLEASDAAGGQDFGISVDIHPSPGVCWRAIVGSINAPNGVDAPGAAYVYAFDGSWFETSKLLASDAADGDLAGYSVALEDNLALVGAPLDTTTEIVSGSGYAWDLVSVPTITCPTDMTFECNSEFGATIFYELPTATDDCNPNPVVDCVPPPGSTFPPGITVVTCTVSNCFGGTDECFFTITVTDEPPTINVPGDATFDCTGPFGGFVFFDDPVVTDDCDPNPDVVCIPPSGSFLTPGDTVITCTATDSAGQSSEDFWVVTIIPDTTDPVFPGGNPANITRECTSDEGTMVGFPDPVAVDDCSVPTVVCVPPSNSEFDLGTTIVTCTATDLHGNSSQVFFNVKIVDTTPPFFDPVLPVMPIEIECTSPDPEPVAYVLPPADDICDDDVLVICVPPSPVVLTLGMPTPIVCNAWDDGDPCNPPNLTVDAFTLLLVDTTPPDLDCTAPDPVECTGPGGQEVAFGTPEATDLCDRNPTVVCDPASPVNVMVGKPVTVTCTATDAEGNESECTFDVVVEDTTPPVIDCPEDISMLCEGTKGTPVTYMATATDICDPDPVVTIDPPSGHAFFLGDNLVTVTATDAEGNEATCVFTVTIFDKEPPSIICPDDITVERTSSDGAIVTFEATATDNCDPSPTVVCTPPSGTLFPPGVTVVNCVATDHDLLNDFCSFTVTVVDTTPPVITCPRDMFFFSHRPLVVDFSVTATDNSDPAPTVVCFPPSGSAFPVGNSTVVNCVATDAAGNSSMCSFTILVTPISEVPALGEWGMIAMTACLLGLGAFVMRRRQLA